MKTIIPLSLEKISIDTNKFFNSNHSDFVKDIIDYDSRIIPYSIFDYNLIEEETYSFYKVNKKNIFIPYGLPAIEHQIAHMVEMNDLSRCLQVNWGMATRSGVNFNYLSDNGLLAATARECRVRAIQSLMCETHWGNSVWNVHVEADIAARLPLGKFNNIEQMRQWYLNLFDSTVKKWSLERIRHEWIRKLSYIQEWMETAQAA